MVFDYFDFDEEAAKLYREVQTVLDKKENIELDETLILSLYQYKILVNKENGSL